MLDVKDAVSVDIQALYSQQTTVNIDHMPPVAKTPEAIALFEWTNPIPEVSGGGSWHYIQLQVRSADPVKARQKCARLVRLLDSGPNEKQFYHGVEYLIYRPRRGAILLERATNTCTYAAEIAVWCNDNEEDNDE